MRLTQVDAHFRDCNDRSVSSSSTVRETLALSGELERRISGAPTRRAQHLPMHLGVLRTLSEVETCELCSFAPNTAQTRRRGSWLPVTCPAPSVSRFLRCTGPCRTPPAASMKRSFFCARSRRVRTWQDLARKRMGRSGRGLHRRKAHGLRQLLPCLPASCSTLP